MATEIVEADFGILDIPYGIEMLVWSKTDKYNERFGKSPATAIFSNGTYYMPTPKNPLSVEELRGIINKRNGGEND